MNKIRSIICLSIPILISVSISISTSLSLIFTSKAYGDQGNPHDLPKSFAIGIGNLTQFPGKIQDDEEGGTFVFEFRPLILTYLKWSLWKNLGLYPEFLMALPEKGPGKHVTRTFYMVKFPLGYQYKDFLFRGGFGFSFTRLSGNGGNGGTDRLNNGNSYAHFPVPSEVTTARNLIVEVGVEYFIPVLRPWSVKVEGHIYNIESSISRTFSYLLGIQYHIPIFE